MRVLLVGTLPPRGGPDARRFAREAVRCAELGDSVETLSGDPLSISHRTASLDGRHLASQLRALSKEFDGVELRVEAGFGLTTGSVGRVASALRTYRHVTLFMDSPLPYESEVGLLSRLCSVADSIVFANQADLASMDFVPTGADKLVVPPVASDLCLDTAPWPEPGEASLRTAVLDVVRARARAEEARMRGASILVTATDRVHPSLVGTSIWLVKRVVGKSRGAVTKVLRPTPRNARGPR
jgi:hypothetical protein